MNRPAKIIGFAILMLPSLALAQSASSAASQTVIYKHVDEQGRVTYANSPIKGGARVELEPLTVIPSTPTGSLSPAAGRTPPPAPAPVMATVTPPAAVKASAATLLSSVPASTAAAMPTPAPAIQVASVLPLSAVATAPKLPAPVTIASTEPTSLETINQLTQQRRDETRKRLLEGELQTEEQMLSAAKIKLAEEQKNSSSVRAMRASFSPTAETATAQKPLISPEIRTEIERHFERVRNLQDQVAMHENHLQGLREQLTKLR